jgi:hypothetical protein
MRRWLKHKIVGPVSDWLWYRQNDAKLLLGLEESGTGAVPGWWLDGWWWIGKRAERVGLWLIQSTNRWKDNSLSHRLHLVADHYDSRPTGKWDPVDPSTPMKRRTRKKSRT